MDIENVTDIPVSTDFELICKLLPIRGNEKLVELGCGPAEVTRKLAHQFPELQIIATDVDKIQHAKNVTSEIPPNLAFLYGGAERIDLPDSSVNYLLMLKSLHHVPMNLMEQGLAEIRRVLVPGGLAYISEPVYAGAFNDILRLFHDEKEVRQAAIDAINHAVSTCQLERVSQFRFESIWKFEGFSDFERRIIGATHNEFNISPLLHQQIESAFAPHINEEGVAEFRSPMRVDLLRRPNRG